MLAGADARAVVAGRVGVGQVDTVAEVKAKVDAKRQPPHRPWRHS